MSRPILFHAEGDARTGLGHLVRMVAVAGELAATENVHCASSSPHLDSVVAELAPWARGAFTCHAMPNSEENPWARGDSLGHLLASLAVSLDARAVVSDGKTAYGKEVFKALRSRARVVLIDNVAAHSEGFDVLVLPTCHADPALTARMEKEPVRTGPAWTFVHPAVKALVTLGPSAANARDGIFISMGGADPRGLTARALRHLLLQTSSQLVAVVGPANGKREELKAIETQANGRVKLVGGSPASQEGLASARYAMCAFGITSYEAVALGVPLLVVAHDGVVDADMDRFARHFAPGVVALPTPEDARAFPTMYAGDAEELGTLGASLAALCP